MRGCRRPRRPALRSARPAGRAARRAMLPAPSAPGAPHRGCWKRVRSANRVRAEANSSLVHTGFGTSSWTAASAQSSSRALSDPSGLLPRTSFVPWIQRPLNGPCDRTVPPTAVAGGCPARPSAALLGCGGEHPDVHGRHLVEQCGISADGMPRAPLLSTMRGSSSRSSGQSRSPVRSSSPATAAATAWRAGAASWSCSSSRSLAPRHLVCRPRLRRRTSHGDAAAACRGRTRRWGPAPRSGAAVRAAPLQQ